MLDTAGIVGSGLRLNLVARISRRSGPRLGGYGFEAWIGSIENRIGDYRQHLRRRLTARQFATLNRQR